MGLQSGRRTCLDGTVHIPRLKTVSYMLKLINRSLRGTLHERVSSNSKTITRS